MLALVLLIAAFILFVLGALPIPTYKVNLMSAGLACWVLAVLVERSST